MSRKVYGTISQSKMRQMRVAAAKGRGPMVMVPASAVVGGKRVYGGRLAPETKYFDVGASDHNIASADDWTGTEVPMDNYIQSDGATVGAYTDSALIPSAVGTGYGQVIATRYLLKKLRIRATVYGTAKTDQADALKAIRVRLVLVMDTNPDGSQAQGENVFTDFSNDPVNVLSFLNMGTTAGKFRILKDAIIVLQPCYAQTDGVNTASNIAGARHLNWSWQPKKPVMVTLKASATTPATSQLQSCNIFLLALATDSAQLSVCSRAYFCE